MLTGVLAIVDGKFVVHPSFDELPAGTQWEAVRYEHEGKALDGGTLTYYVARTPAVAARLAQGRAVFTEAELYAARPRLADETNAGVLEWLQVVATIKTMFTGARVESTGRPTMPPGVAARFIGRDGEPVDLSPGPVKRPEPAKRPDPEPPPPGLV